MKRLIYIPKGIIRQAARDNEFLDALSLCLLIKSQHSNSMLLDFSLRKIMSLCGCNGKKAKEIWQMACRCELVTMDESNRHVIAKTFRNGKRQGCIQFTVHQTPYGNRICLKDCGKRKQNKQTISEVRDTVLTAALLIGIDGYNHTINTCIKSVNYRKTEEHFSDISSGVRKKNYDVKTSGRDTAANPLKRGYSYKSMLRNIYNDSISKYKMVKLIKEAYADGLIDTWENKYMLMKRDMETCEPLDIHDFFVTINHETGEKKCQYKKSITAKQCKKSIVYYHHLANGYQNTAGVSCYKKNWKLINSLRKGA